jgi:hypothetical protein
LAELIVTMLSILKNVATGRQDSAVPAVVERENGVRTPTPSGQMYLPLLEAFNHFNSGLFGGELRDCLISIRAKGKTSGFYHPKRFVALESGAMVDEIALNPTEFLTQSLRETAATLVHEMTHHWREYAGRRPPRSGYHDRMWATRMREIGLAPSATGAAGGQETGDSVSHYVLEGGPFALSFERLLASGWQIIWGDAPLPAAGAKSKLKRITLVCNGCGAKADVVPSVGDLTHIRCGGHMTAR